MASLTRVTALAVFATGILAGSSVFAQSQADFDACNQKAAAKAQASVSASPSSSPGTSLGGSTMTAPGSADVNRVPNATGRISGSAGSPGSDAGTVTGGGAASSSLQNGPVYQQAFRDCLKARGF